MQLRTRVGSLVIAGLLIAAPASAQMVHSISGGLGGFFWPKGFDGRATGDIWVEDLFPASSPDLGLAFEIGDFKAGNVFGEWAVSFGNRFEFGAGLSYYSQTVHSIYRDVENECQPEATTPPCNQLPPGTRVEIPQDLRLRMLPITGVVRVLASRPGSIQPYVGGGISAINFRYSEIGEFVDPSDGLVFPESYRKSGTVPAGVFLLGVRIPIGGDIYGITTEYRYQWGVGDLTGAVPAFPASKIDLSGGYLNFGFLVRF